MVQTLFRQFPVIVLILWRGKKKERKSRFFLKHDFIRMLEILLEVVKHSKNLSDFVNGLGEKAILNVAAWNEVEICILKHSLGFCFSRPVFQLCQTWGCSRLPSLAYEGCYEFQSQEISTCLKLSEIIYFKSRFGLSRPHAYLTVLSLFVRFQAMNTIYCLKFLFFFFCILLSNLLIVFKTIPYEEVLPFYYYKPVCN